MIDKTLMSYPDVFSSDRFVWNSGRGRSSVKRLCLDNFPKSFYIHSARTGKSLLFTVDTETMELKEFFDGEAIAYISEDERVTVQIWNGDY